MINTNGLAFIGPGSEWFWTALTGVVMAVTFIAIYRQLSTARSASAVDQMEAVDRELGSERMLRAQLGILLALQNGEDPAYLKAVVAEAEVVGNFWEKVGSLTRRGHFDARLLWDGSAAGTVRTWWVALRPYARTVRAALKAPQFWENFEWLWGAMAALDRPTRPADAPVLDEAWLASDLERQVSLIRDLVRFEETLRAVTVATPRGARRRTRAAAPHA